MNKMKSLNDNFKIRNSNIFWTISENYRLIPDVKYITKIHGKGRNYLFYAILSGGIHKYLDLNLIDYHVENIKKTSNNPEVFIEILFLLIEENILFKQENDRRGIKDFKISHYKTQVHWFDYHPPKDVLSEIRNVYYTMKLNKYPKTSNEILTLVYEILNTPKKITTEELINKTYFIMKNYFHFENSYFEEKIKSDSDDELASSDHLNKVPEKAKFFSKSEIKEENIEEYVSAEYNPNESVLAPREGYESEFSLKEVNMDSNEYTRMRNKIESRFGKAIITDNELYRLENNICKDIHNGCRLHITNGEFSFDVKNTYRVSYLNNQKKINLEEFDSNQNIYRRNITRLKEIILRSILANTEIGTYKSHRGSFIASNTWKSLYLNDFKVFNKNTKDEIGNFVVDVLLDSSGSQIERQGKVAAQGFIISEALSLCHIPTRVIGFNNFLDFTILKQYRNYDDPIIKNSNIFGFHTSGTNRDGLAIRAVVDSLSKRYEENKILIILSDGKPNDIRITNTASSSIKGELDYKGYKAIRDTAFEVRKARQKGIAVLGIYTGEERDLETQKLIFGRDFAYIKNIDRFSDLVGFYLKKHIENMLDP